MKNKNTNLNVGRENKANSISHLRQDLVTGDWVVIATGRGKRPDDFKKKEKQEKESLKNVEECLFCDPVASGQEEDVLIYTTGEGDWTLRIFPNKYPAFSRPNGGRINHKEEGPYFWMDGIGYHEVIVTRDHFKHIGLMDPIWVAEILDAYQTRYLDLMNKKSVRYIEIFHNHGKGELDGSEEYYRANKKCVFCDMVEWELSHKKRVVFENEDFVVITPFASRIAFEMWVLPKKHSPYFERISDEQKVTGGEALHEAIRRIGKVLDEPDFNFYLHTAPCDGNDYPHYHWHIEILPKTSTWAGFELSTGIEVSAMEPEESAKYLREA